MINWLIRMRTIPLVGRLAHELLALYGLEVPDSVTIGRGTRVVHHGFGVVIHPEVTIGKDVTIFHGVTIGRFDAYLTPRGDSPFKGVSIGDGSILYAGATVVGGPGHTHVGAGTVVAAGAVLRNSTGDNEVWAGVPAKLVGIRHVASTPTPNLNPEADAE